MKVTGLTLRQNSKVLEVSFDNGDHFVLACELLRVYSPSAEVHGHGAPVLVTNKKEVNIVKIEPIGNYAVKLVFDDGHDSGLYSWSFLHQLGREQAQLWSDYLTRLKAAKASREALLPLKVQFYNPDNS